MSEQGEYLRLPHGMFDREESWILKKRSILDLHHSVGQGIGCDLAEFSPVCFSSTFRKASNTTGDKTYEFDDRSGRSLMLSSDSAPSYMRHYLNNYPQSDEARFAFVAPLFRYRRTPTRHFTQIGYVSINEPESTNAVDIPLVEFAEAISEICGHYHIKNRVLLNDLSVLKKLCVESGVDAAEVPEFLHKLQFAGKTERVHIIHNQCKDSSTKNDLIKILTSEIELLGSASVSPVLSTHYGDLVQMGKALHKTTGADIFFDTANLHSAETISRYMLLFQKEDGTHLGDGGIYNSYANTFSSKITTLRGVATRVEAIEGNGVFDKLEKQNERLVILQHGATPEFVLHVRQKLKELFKIVSCTQVTKNMSKSLNKAAKKNDLVVVLGAIEEQNKEIEIRHLHDREVPRQKLVL